MAERVGIRVLALVALLALTFGVGSAFAQVDLSGNWNPILHEDQPERIPGPALVDYGGLPITEAARQWALSWDPSRLTLPEHQCQVHVSPYIYRGPLALRIWDEKDPNTQQVIAQKHYISTYEQTRTIYLDARPHPPDHAANTWAGFSTGRWNGDMFTVETTHIKQGWLRRNGIPESDRTTLTEHFLRHGDILTRISVITDPVYLTEPLVKSDNFQLNLRAAPGLWPCEYVVEVADRARGDVPHYLPGKNPFLREYADRFGLPIEAVLGGPETMYPEYVQKLKQAAAGGQRR